MQQPIFWSATAITGLAGLVAKQIRTPGYAPLPRCQSAPRGVSYPVPNLRHTAALSGEPARLKGGSRYWPQQNCSSYWKEAPRTSYRNTAETNTDQSPICGQQ